MWLKFVPSTLQAYGLKHYEEGMTYDKQTYGQMDWHTTWVKPTSVLHTGVETHY